MRSEVVAFLNEHGLMQVLSEAQEMVGRSRITVGTNDIAILASVSEDGTARMDGVARVDLHRILNETLGDLAPMTRAYLAEPVSPDRYLLVVQYKDVWICLDLPVADTTEGTLN